jgi:hypothetical protein
VNVALIPLNTFKTGYLFGTNLTDGDGTPVADAFLEGILEAQQELLSEETGVDVGGETYREFTERLDLVGNTMLFVLSHRPVRQVLAAKVRVGSLPVMELPAEWIDVRSAKAGHVQIVPIQGTANATSLGGLWALYATGRIGSVQGQWEFRYQGGFKESDAPKMFTRALGLRAANAFLRQAGDLILGPGQASRSISLGGVSESSTSTASAMYSGYSAQMEENQKELDVLIPQLRASFGGGLRVFFA